MKKHYLCIGKFLPLKTKEVKTDYNHDYKRYE